MNGFVKYLILLIALAIGNVIYKMSIKKPIVLPDEDIWWGPGELEQEDLEIRPFKINIPDQVLVDLKQRLQRTKSLVPPLAGVQHQYGLNTDLLKEILKFWQTKYEWREREKFLNQFPQYQLQVQGLKIHYIHVKPTKIPTGTKTVPLLLLHGWPGSVREFYELIPMLTTPESNRKIVFEIIAPSLPGYGFSEAAAKPGLGVAQMAAIFKQLMTKKLGFKQFYVQGGDWGSVIATTLATYYPNIVKGIHISGCHSNSPIAIMKLLAGSFWPSLIVDKKHEHKIYPLSNLFLFYLEELGYLHLQATKPDTIGVALNDSPAGLAAYILEKFITWTNRDWIKRADGGLTEKYDYTKLLDNVMIYWVTNSITTSMRLYSESMNSQQNIMSNAQKVLVPAACAMFQNEPIYQPVDLFKEKYTKVIQANEYDAGHFNSFEAPNLVAKDVFEFVEKVEAKKSGFL